VDVGDLFQVLDEFFEGFAAFNHRVYDQGFADFDISDGEAVLEEDFGNVPKEPEAGFFFYLQPYFQMRLFA